MKKIIATVLAFVMLLGTVAIGVPEEGIRLDFGLSAFAASEVASGTCGENLTWTLDSEGTLTISGSGRMYDWTDFSTAPWYKNASSIKKIEVENGVASIGGWAFKDCISLESITIPDSVTSIGKIAFKNCVDLKNVVIPSGVTKIDTGTFVHCSSLTDVTLPDSVTDIGVQAFYGCSSLEEITLPDSVESIGVQAFFDCENLTSVFVPKRVSSIDSGAFAYCSKLTEFDVDEENDYFSDACGILYTKDITELVCCPAGTVGSVNIPESVTGIDDYAFAGGVGLTEISIPDGVTRIGESTFASCTSLADIDIPFGTKSIGESAFYCCYGLTSIEIPATVAVIEEDAFSYCSNLKSVTISHGVASIERAAFFGCSAMEIITIPSSVTNIDYVAFLYCSNLTDVYYGGTEEDWNNITVGDINNALFDANKHFTIKISDDSSCFVAYLSGDDENVDENTRLNVNIISDESPAVQMVFEALSELGGESVLYDVFFTANGTEVQPAKTVTVKIPVPDSCNADECKVYYIADDGTYTDMNAVPDGNYLVFTTDHFSYYAVVHTAARLPGDINSDGKISMLDSTVLRRWLAGWDVTISESNADVNGDGEVTLLDSTILRRYLAGWQGVELK